MERQEPRLNTDTSKQVDAVDERIAELLPFLASQDGFVRHPARIELVHIGKRAVPALLVALKSTDNNMRWEAAKALEDIADPSSADGLVVALEDTLFGVRWLAAEGVINLGRVGLIALLTAMVHRPNSVWLRESAHHVLKLLALRKTCGLGPVIRPVLAALDGPAPDIQAPLAAENALVQLRKDQN